MREQVDRLPILRKSGAIYRELIAAPRNRDAEIVTRTLEVY